MDMQQRETGQPLLHPLLLSCSCGANAVCLHFSRTHTRSPELCKPTARLSSTEKNGSCQWLNDCSVFFNVLCSPLIQQHRQRLLGVLNPPLEVVRKFHARLMVLCRLMFSELLWHFLPSSKGPGDQFTQLQSTFNSRAVEERTRNAKGAVQLSAVGEPAVIAQPRRSETPVASSNKSYWELKSLWRAFVLRQQSVLLFLRKLLKLLRDLLLGLAVFDEETNVDALSCSGTGTLTGRFAQAHRWTLWDRKWNVLIHTATLIANLRNRLLFPTSDCPGWTGEEIPGGSSSIKDAPSRWLLASGSSLADTRFAAGRNGPTFGRSMQHASVLVPFALAYPWCSTSLFTRDTFFYKGTDPVNERRQADFFARKLLHSAVWANVRWKRDGYRTSPNQNRRWLVVGFRIRPISLGKSRRFYVHRPAPFRGFATRTKKKKKKKKKEKKRTFVVSGGVRPNPPNPPCVRAWLNSQKSNRSCLPMTTRHASSTTAWPGLNNGRRRSLCDLEMLGPRISGDRQQWCVKNVRLEMSAAAEHMIIEQHALDFDNVEVIDC